jgi:hypothetical protein
VIINGAPKLPRTPLRVTDTERIQLLDFVSNPFIMLFPTAGEQW